MRLYSYLPLRPIQIIIGAMFIVSGWIKLKQPSDFLRDLYGYQLIGPPFGQWLAVGMPALEVVAGLSVWISNEYRWRVLAVSLAAVFVIAQVSALWRGLDANCGCGIVPGEKVGWSSIGRSLAMLLVLALPVRRRRAPSTSDS